MKKCFKCKIEKELSEFYKHSEMKDGHLNKCIECAKYDVRKHRRENDSVREYDLWRHYNNERRRNTTIEHSEIWRNKNPEARRAHNIVARAIRFKELTKQPCDVCGTMENLHAHHDDYTKPLIVKWLCAKHHQRLHNPF